MIQRRAFLVSGCAFAAVPLVARAEDLLSIKGSLLQSSLVVGTAAVLPESVVVDGNAVSVSHEGYFVFGLNYDQRKPTTVVAKFNEKEIVTKTIVPVVRKYDTQHVNGLPQKFVTPLPDVEERIKRENAMVAEARKRDTAATDFVKPFDWPIKGIVSGTFGNQRIDNGTPMTPHFGVDIAAPKGTPIHAPSGGIVSLAEPDFYLTGGTTMLDHGHGVSTVYIHQDEVRVKVGDAVKRGDVIGLVGMKGRATGPHLHWGMNWFQMRLDPSLSAITPAPEKA
jgi:murein DD-endopeptidase MepM/ murein hydrolase activator NlpD